MLSCVVSSPQAPLTIHDEPNGTVQGQLTNRTAVLQLSTAPTDGRWVQIAARDRRGLVARGMVERRYLECRGSMTQASCPDLASLRKSMGSTLNAEQLATVEEIERIALANTCSGDRPTSAPVVAANPTFNQPAAAVSSSLRADLRSCIVNSPHGPLTIYSNPEGPAVGQLPHQTTVTQLSVAPFDNRWVQVASHDGQSFRARGMVARRFLDCQGSTIATASCADLGSLRHSMRATALNAEQLSTVEEVERIEKSKACNGMRTPPGYANTQQYAPPPVTALPAPTSAVSTPSNQASPVVPDRGLQQSASDLRRRTLWCATTYFWATHIAQEGLSNGTNDYPLFLHFDKRASLLYRFLGEFDAANGLPIEAAQEDARAVRKLMLPGILSLGDVAYFLNGREQCERLVEQINEAAIQPNPAKPSPSTSSVPSPPGKTDTTGPKISTGTGFFVSSDGHVLTNAHVVKGCTSTVVSQPGGRSEPARIIATDATNDLALLSVAQTAWRPTGVPNLKAGVRQGEEVAAYGFPHVGMLATSGTITSGTVSATAGLGDDSRMLQISAPVQSGNSGGPLMDQAGNVVGIVTSKLNVVRALEKTGDLPQNVNFAIKASVARIFLEANGTVGSPTPSAVKLSAPDLADVAKTFTVFIACRE
jgi:S1-C subfamily serine protease